MRQLKSLILLMALAAAAILWSAQGTSERGASIGARTSGFPASPHIGTDAGLPGFLPPEARTTLSRIASGGPFAHRQDGAVFGNYEHLLPQKPRGYYHEYTVETPDADTRGARRIITGGTPPDVYYYTDNHYRSFRLFEVRR